MALLPQRLQQRVKIRTAEVKPEQICFNQPAERWTLWAPLWVHTNTNNTARVISTCQSDCCVSFHFRFDWEIAASLRFDPRDPRRRRSFRGVDFPLLISRFFGLVLVVDSWDPLERERSTGKARNVHPPLGERRDVLKSLNTQTYYRRRRRRRRRPRLHAACRCFHQRPRRSRLAPVARTSIKETKSSVEFPWRGSPRRRRLSFFLVLVLACAAQLPACVFFNVCPAAAAAVACGCWYAFLNFVLFLHLFLGLPRQYPVSST